MSVLLKKLLKSRPELMKKIDMILEKEAQFCTKVEMEDQFLELSKKQEMRDKIIFKKTETFVNHRIDKRFC